MSPEDPAAPLRTDLRGQPGIAPSGQPWQFTALESFPPLEKWDDWVEYDSASWPRKVEKRYRLVPTTCFNCEAACGLVAYVDKSNGQIRKLEGNPFHPGSRGRNCAKGPATLNQVTDPERILHPLKRVGPRGSGKWERTTWDEVLTTFAARIRKALVEERRTEVMYHVGRPGHDGYMDRVLQSWGVDGHNSHTNVCSAAARLGYVVWSGADRPSPDHAKAKFILLISAHLESGHYFNPHAQRIIEGKMAGAKLAVVDVRLSNTASMADHWIAPHPGTEAALLLGIAKAILDEGLENRPFLRTWVNWREWLAARHPRRERTFETFLDELRRLYELYTPEWVAKECGIDAGIVRVLAREIGKAGPAFSSHVWRSAASGNEGGWAVARCLQFLSVLTGAVGSEGGTGLAPSNKFVPAPWRKPSPQTVWSELLYPQEWPLAHHELSYLLPHFLKQGRGRVDVYFTRVYNPVWTNPDGATWMEVLEDESKVGLHAALTPVWSETALLADYVLPMGLGPERHDLMSQETHAGRWISFRQPVLRRVADLEGRPSQFTHETNPGEVWEEDEFWIRLSWAIDSDGSLGIRKNFESPYRPGECITVEEYYRWIFENSVPGLPEAARAKGLTPLGYMQTYGAFEVVKDAYRPYVAAADVTGAERDEDLGIWTKDGAVVAVADADGRPVTGFGTPSRRLELWSPTLEDWAGPQFALPAYVKSHVHRDEIDESKNEFVLVPTFRLPTLIHTRSGNAKWLYELSNSNPVWIHTSDAARLGVETGDLVRVATRIGAFVNKAWVTECIRPGVVACSHHLGRWRVEDKPGTDRWAAPPVAVTRTAEGRVRLRRTGDIGPWESSDPDSRRVWWRDGGVHQNLTFPVQPDPVSGMHCWHQKVTVEKARPEDRYGDVEVDREKAHAVYLEWLAKAPVRPRPGNLRRPTWLPRAVRPAASAYKLPDPPAGGRPDQRGAGR
jgi:anaerobic selenocysteine-containing dehydrogenase